MYLSLKQKWENLINFFAKDYEQNKLNIELGKYVALFGHGGYWFLWTYIYPQQYESAFIRFTAIGLFIPFLFRSLIAKNSFFRGFLGIYWYLCSGFNLPFLFTYMLLMNNFSGMWLICTTMALSMFITLIPNILIFTIVLSISIISAYFTFLVNSSFHLYLTQTHLEYFLIVPMILIGGVLFNYSAKCGELKIAIAARTKTLQSLGGSIAHEMRNPLGSIQQSVHLLLDKLKQIPEVKKTNRLVVYRREVEEVSDLLKIINRSSVRGNMIIDMILSNIHGKEIDKSKFKIHKISHTVNSAINEFAFGSKGEKKKVLLNIERDFDFKGDENMFVFVIFNLLKNALYYLKTYPDSTITISTRKEDETDKKFNHFYFKDTGAGIPQDKLESIFESFMTSGKAGGTGLGLPFCKRVINAFGGKISCNSQLEEYTEFVISLPQISEEDKKNKDLYIEEVEEIDFKKAIKEKFSNKTILLVDDQLVNRRISASRLEKLGFNAIMAQHGKEALNILDKRGAEIDIILMDLQMPEINGYETTKLIQSGQKNKAGHKFQNCQNHKNIIIIAFTGDDDEVTLQRIEDHNMKGCLGKSWSDKELFNVLNQIL